ncbi:hypothetical protein INT47_012573 [Mucor saturninus]|uniref:F-box domain-containing protein n=1 Tax=Mucor saturninus TaxID=64648 RepID=A0A8H7R166_9FUNG|nr:hypothetical protein INT47_012573 [Mucor saturninus]
MSNWGQLPTKVLTEIFKLLKLTHLDKLEFPQRVSQQMLVCKNWCRIAKTFLYKDVTMLSVKQQDTFLRCMTRDSTGMNQLVHSFKAFDENTNSKLEEDLGLILNALPNLQQLHARPKKGRFFARLLLELYSSSDRPIQLARIPDYYTEMEDDVKMYQYAIWALKKTLRRMVLPDWCVQPYHITTPLEEFKNLTHLELRVFHVSQLFQMAVIIFPQCPNLTHLHIARDAKLQPIKDEQQITAMIDLGHFQPAFHIAMLKIDTSVVTFSPYSMYMLMVLFPKLDSWLMYTNMNNKDYYQYDPISRKIPIEAWVQFLTYVNKIKSFHGLHLAISSLHQVLKEISSSTGFCKEISVKYDEWRLASDNQNDPILDILPSGIHDMDRTCDYKKHGTIISYFQNNDISELPHVSLIEQIGFQLERLTLDLGTISDHLMLFHILSDYDKKSLGRFINLIFKHCPVLRALVIRRVFLVLCDDNDIEAPLSFKFLHLQECVIYQRTNFLVDLSRRLPFRLEWMAIERCDFTKEANAWPHVNMPFTMLGCLFISREYWSMSKYARMVIKIAKASQKPLYFCLNDKHKLESLSGQEAFEIYAKNETSYVIQITCADIEKLLIRVFGSPVLIFPKEKVEYIDGQHYINSTTEFRHVQI